VLEEGPVQNIAEDRHERVIRVRLDVERDEVTDIPVGDIVLSGAGRSHSCNVGEVADLSEFLFFGENLEPSLVVHPLTEQFNWRLSGVNSGRLDLGHAQVINEDNSHLVVSGAVVELPEFETLSIDNVLGLVGSGLRGEGHLNMGILFIVVLASELLADHNGLTGTGGSNDQHVLLVFQESVEDTLDTDGVSGRDNHLTVG